MASLQENCLNCQQTFYKQSLHPLKLEDFTFAGRRFESLACFVESHEFPGCPKVCNSCLSFLRASHVVNKRSILANEIQQGPAHACVTCHQLNPVTNLMNMRLTVVRTNGRQVNLEECVKICLKTIIRTDVNLMICLACMSAIVEEYDRVKSLTTEPEFFEVRVKVEVDEDVGPAAVVSPTCSKAVKLETQFPDFLENPRMPIKVEPDVKEMSISYPRHPKTFRKQRRRRCFVCYETKFKDFQDYMAHVKSHRQADGKIRCPHCDSKHHYRDMHGHMVSHLPKDFTCYHCEYATTTLKKLEHHLIGKHFPDLRYLAEFQCDICSISFSRANQLRSHKCVWRPKQPFECNECGATFKVRHPLRTHLLKHFPEAGGAFQCSVCKKVFKEKVAYKRHLSHYAAYIQVYKCTQCDTAFHKKYELNKHNEKVHQKSYYCQICKIPFWRVYSFNAHLKKKHGVQSQSQCRACQATFDTAQQLKEHQDTSHPIPIDKCTCETCGKTFPDLAKLKKHSIIHKTDRTFICEQFCGKAYKTKTTLDSHIKNMHLRTSAERPKITYPCPQCPFVFTRFPFLDAHMIVHNTENRPYFQCFLCGIAFTRKQKLQKHALKCPELKTNTNLVQNFSFGK